MNNVHYSSKSAEHYTPQHIIAAVLRVMVEIDLDPCAETWGSNANVPAKRRYTVEDDGLSKPWFGRVYMNPPYGREIGKWVDKLMGSYLLSGEVDQAIALVPARMDTAWWLRLTDYHPIVCFIQGRPKFGGATNSAPFPSAVVYYGTRQEEFRDAFTELGPIWLRWD